MADYQPWRPSGANCGIQYQYIVRIDVEPRLDDPCGQGALGWISDLCHVEKQFEAHPFLDDWWRYRCFFEARSEAERALGLIVAALAAASAEGDLQSYRCEIDDELVCTRCEAFLPRETCSISVPAGADGNDVDFVEVCICPICG